MKTFDDYSGRNKVISQEIAKAEIQNDHDKQIELKRELYKNKLLMIDILEYQNKKNSISAKGLIYKVDNMPKVIRYATGLSYLDKNLKINQQDYSEQGGIEVGSLVILGGQSGAGKSHIMLEMLSNVSRYAKCVFFNFEMGDRRLATRLRRLLTTDEQLNNFTINSESRDLDELLMEINIMAQEGVKFFAIDSKMKITVKGSEAEYQKISKITKLLSETAVKNDIIVLLINQISEDNLKTKTLAFKGSGDQLYDADIALFLTIEDDDKRKLICKKNRQDERLFNEILPELIKEPITVEYHHEDIKEETEHIEMSVL
jgi:hypothetical protein